MSMFISTILLFTSEQRNALIQSIIVTWVVVPGTVTVIADSGLLHGSSVAAASTVTLGSRRGDEGALQLHATIEFLALKVLLE